MPVARSQGVAIRYRVVGEGPPLVLVHGWTASGRLNWELPGWVEYLRPHYRLVLPDLRGHGRSAKPHGQEAYSLELMAADVLAVMDAAGVGQARVMGYSMGGMIALELLVNHGERFTAAVVGGMGLRFPRGRTRADCRDEEQAEAAPRQRDFGKTLRGVGSFLRHYDPLAQRAVWRGVFKDRQPVRQPERLGEVQQPVLIVVGSRDPLCPGTRELQAELPNARREVLPGRNHLSAVSDPRFKALVREFFAANG